MCSNVSTQYDASEIAPRLKSELMNALQPALATLSANKVQYYEIPAHTLEISEALNEQLSNVWRKKRGIEAVSYTHLIAFHVHPVKLVVRHVVEGTDSLRGDLLRVPLCLSLIHIWCWPSGWQSRR